MSGLLASQAFWLLGIDDQLRRPKAPHVRIGLAAAALVDLIDAGGISWTGPVDEPGVALLPFATDDALLAIWHARLLEAITGGGCRAVFAIDALYRQAWTDTAVSLLSPGWSREHRMPIFRRLSYAPTAAGLAVAVAIRDEARVTVSDARPPVGVGHSLVAACESSGVSEFVLSEAWSVDEGIGLQVTHALAGDPLTRRLTVALAPLLGAATVSIRR